jgi:hypothetical protein
LNDDADAAESGMFRETDVNGAMASGVVDNEVFVGGIEVVDTRLPLDELLDMVVARVPVADVWLGTWCLARGGTNAHV